MQDNCNNVMNFSPTNEIIESLKNLVSAMYESINEMKDGKDEFINKAKTKYIEIKNLFDKANNLNKENIENYQALASHFNIETNEDYYKSPDIFFKMMAGFFKEFDSAMTREINKKEAQAKRLNELAANSNLS